MIGHPDLFAVFVIGELENVKELIHMREEKEDKRVRMSKEKLKRNRSFSRTAQTLCETD